MRATTAWTPRLDGLLDPSLDPASGAVIVKSDAGLINRETCALIPQGVQRGHQDMRPGGVIDDPGDGHTVVHLTGDPNPRRTSTHNRSPGLSRRCAARARAVAVDAA